MAVTSISDLNLFNAILIIGVAIATMYMGARIKLRPLKILYFLLPSFLLIHGLYHLFYFVGDYSGEQLYFFVGDSVLEPVSYAVFLAFSIYFAKRGG